ncbi:MAG: protein kinase [Pseudomonadota bacterium]|nr:protein kinase [Pseudomonadota bacterium]
MPELAGRYLLGDVLGTGGTSTVYRAMDATLGVERAVKVLRGEGEGIDAQRARLRAEARAMARVTHPNILRVYDVGTDEGHDFFVMELADGGTLQDRVDAEGPLCPLVVCRYALQVLGALAAAHDAGVIHRDVKPQNVLLDRDGVALLADFGIALLADGRESRHTRVGVAMGSMTYMPPEQRIDARTVGVGADVYATGATLYSVLTGATPVDLFLASAASARWDDVPAALRPILQRATRLAPSERYTTARDMAAAVLAVMPRLTPLPAPSPKDEAAWAGIRDRVLASLAGPVAPPDPLEPTGPIMPHPGGKDRRKGPKAAPTMQSAGLGPAALSGRRVWPDLVILTGLFLAIAGVGAGAMWYVIAPRAAERASLASATSGASLEPAAAVGGETGVPLGGLDTDATAPPTPGGEGLADPETSALLAAPTSAEGARPTSKRRAAPASAAVPGGAVASPTGSWKGSFNGKEVRFEIEGENDSLSGTVTVTFQGNAIPSDVRGRYDPDTHIVELTDVAQRPDSGRYTARLTDEPAMEGRFEAGENGRVVPFRVVPVK